MVHAFPFFLMNQINKIDENFELMNSFHQLISQITQCNEK